ncbi:MAG: TRAP transporter substrate-binding protein [Thermodesulfobacteriota bacterium]|nr:TRAP transporter substrate-binding protein [Thermodesulfobacteriota bacterium]
MKHWKVFTLILCTSVIAFSLFISSVSAQPKPVELNYSTFFPAPHRMTVLAVEWGKELEKRTDGRVKVTMFPGGTLTKGEVAYDGVVKGISDFALSVLGYTRGKFPLTEVIDLPLGYKTGYAATRVINDYYKKFKPKEFDEVQVMYFHAHGPGILHTKKPVNKLEDLKGMKIRSTGLAAKIVEKLGGAPVAMPMGETYDALSRGVVEGSMAPIEALQGWKWGEVVKFTTENFGSSYSTGFFVVMNKAKWAALPPDTQRIIEKLNEEWIEKTGKAWDEIDKAGKDFVLKLGNKITPLSQEEDWRWTKLVKPIYDDYVKDMKAKGLPGEEALKFSFETLYKYQK